MDTDLQAIVEDFAKKVVDGIKKNIETKDAAGNGPMDNTGEAKNSLGYRIEGDRLTIFSSMSRSFNYIMSLETGRGPGKMPPVQPIEEWVKQRGINPPDISQKSLAFLIARRIGEQGTKLFQKGGNSGIISDFTNEKYVKENLNDKVAKVLIEKISHLFLEAA